MPTPVSAVMTLLDGSVNEELIRSLEAKIDVRLTDYDYVSNSRKGSRETGYFYSFTFECTLNHVEQDRLKNDYLSVGYSNVFIIGHNDVNNKLTITIFLPVQVGQVNKKPKGVSPFSQFPLSQTTPPLEPSWSWIPNLDNKGHNNFRGVMFNSHIEELRATEKLIPGFIPIERMTIQYSNVSSDMGYPEDIVATAFGYMRKLITGFIPWSPPLNFNPASHQGFERNTSWAEPAQRPSTQSAPLSPGRYQFGQLSQILEERRKNQQAARFTDTDMSSAPIQETPAHVAAVYKSYADNSNQEKAKEESSQRQSPVTGHVRAPHGVTDFQQQFANSELTGPHTCRSAVHSTLGSEDKKESSDPTFPLQGEMEKGNIDLSNKRENSPISSCTTLKQNFPVPPRNVTVDSNQPKSPSPDDKGPKDQ